MTTIQILGILTYVVEILIILLIGTCMYVYRKDIKWLIRQFKEFSIKDLFIKGEK